MEGISAAADRRLHASNRPENADKTIVGPDGLVNLHAPPMCDSWVLEMAAHANLLSDVRLCKHGAKVMVVGSKAEAVEFNPRLLLPKEVSVHGVFLPTASEEEKQKTHAALFEAMASGKLTPIVGAEVALRDAGVAHEEVMAPSSGGKVGNIVVIIG